MGDVGAVRLQGAKPTKGSEVMVSARTRVPPLQLRCGGLKFKRCYFHAFVLDGCIACYVVALFLVCRYFSVGSHGFVSQFVCLVGCHRFVVCSGCWLVV